MFAAAHESEFGTFRTSQAAVWMSAYWGWKSGRSPRPLNLRVHALVQ